MTSKRFIRERHIDRGLTKDRAGRRAAALTAAAEEAVRQLIAEHGPGDHEDLALQIVAAATRIPSVDAVNLASRISAIAGKLVPLVHEADQAKAAGDTLFRRRAA